MTKEPVVDGLDQLRSDILRICSRLLESTDLTVDDDFFDKGGDSLLATELMLELRQMTGKALPDSLLFESSTVRSLAQRLSEKETPQPKAAVRVGAASDGAMPLMFFHGDWTRGGFYVEHLARKLGPEISLIAVAPHGLGGEPIPPSIEAMAADRLPAILEAQPTGPYRLAGHCVGGIVALETARLLMKMNRQVETVIMIDSPWFIDGEVLKSPQRAPGDGDAGAHELFAALGDDVPIRPSVPEIDWGYEPYSGRLAAYSPNPLAVRLLAIAASFDGRPWARLSGHGVVQETHVAHFDLLTGRINELASRLRSWLSGNTSLGMSEPHPLAPTSKDETSSVGSSKRESQQSPAREREDRALASAMSNKEIPAPTIGVTKHESLSRRLRQFFNYARR
jgi:pimeloyl-ACP methyl ester carboxylesterase